MPTRKILVVGGGVRGRDPQDADVRRVRRPAGEIDVSAESKTRCATSSRVASLGREAQSPTHFTRHRRPRRQGIAQRRSLRVIWRSSRIGDWLNARRLDRGLAYRGSLGLICAVE